MTRSRLALWTALGALVVIPSVAYLAARALGSSFVTSELEERGLACDGLVVDVGWDLASASVGPTRCAMAEGRLERIELHDAASVTLRSWAVSSIDVPRISLAQRIEPAVAEAERREMIAALLDGSVPPPLREGIDSLAAIAAQENVPRVSIDELVTSRARRTIVLREIALARAEDGAIAMTVGSVTPPARGAGPLQLTSQIVGLTAHATPSEVVIEGSLHVAVELGPLEAERAIRFRAQGHGLEGASPTYEMWLEPSPHLSRARELMARLEERLETGQELRRELREHVEERREEQRERMEERRERVHQLSEQLERAVEEQRTR